MKNSTTYSIKEANKKNIAVMAEIQSLEREIEANSELRDEFMDENDMFMANGLQDDISADTWRKIELERTLNAIEKRFMETNAIYFQNGEGGSDFYYTKA